MSPPIWTLVYMGIFDALSKRIGPLPTPRLPIASPWAESGNLIEVARADILGMTRASVTRAEAMKIPSITKARALICGTLSRYPLTVWNSDQQVDTPAWLTSTSESGVSPQARMLWTLDDLLFHGGSLWAIDRDPDGTVIDALRVPPGMWQVEPTTGLIQIDGVFCDPDTVCLIEGPQEGLTTIAADTISASLALERAWRMRVESPVPLVELHSTDPNIQLTPEEIADLVADWEEARREGGTAYTPNEIEAKPWSGGAADLFIEGRNAVRLDIANFTNVPAGLLEGSTATASLTYSTKEGDRNEVVDYSLSYWATPIEARLSQDDILPAGLSCRFDLQWLATPVQTGVGPKWED